MDDNLISAESARWFVKQMTCFGLNLKDLLSGTGLPNQWIHQVSDRLSFNQYLQIVLRALDLTGDPALGLKVGRGLNLFEYGVWGYAIMSCATAGEAMTVALRYWELNGALVNISMKIGKDAVVWDIEPAFQRDDDRLVRFAVEELLSTFHAAGSFLLGRKMNILFFQFYNVYSDRRITSR